METVVVEFNPCEAAIYQIVRARFLDKLNNIGKKDALERSYKTIFALLTRLRQLVSSPLLIQKTLKELLEAEDLNRLWLLVCCPISLMLIFIDSPQTEDRTAAANEEDGAIETAEALQLALTTIKPDDPSMSRVGSSSAEPDSFVITGAGPKSSLCTQFRKYLNQLEKDGQWAKINERSLCHACGQLPVRPQITACMHVYCNACLQDLKYEAAGANQDDATCRACGTRFKKSEAFAAKEFEPASTEGKESPGSTRNGNRKGKKKDEEEEGIDWFNVDGPILQSAKTKAAVKKMEQWWSEDKTAKIIIFVQFRGMIEIFCTCY